MGTGISHHFLVIPVVSSQATYLCHWQMTNRSNVCIIMCKVSDNVARGPAGCRIMHMHTLLFVQSRDRSKRNPNKVVKQT